MYFMKYLKLACHHFLQCNLYLALDQQSHKTSSMHPFSINISVIASSTFSTRKIVELNLLDIYHGRCYHHCGYSQYSFHTFHLGDDKRSATYRTSAFSVQLIHLHAIINKIADLVKMQKLPSHCADNFINQVKLHIGQPFLFQC